MEKAGIPIPRYRVCETTEEVEKSTAELGISRCLVRLNETKWDISISATVMSTSAACSKLKSAIHLYYVK